MRKRPLPITILSLYLMIVFSISLVGSIYGAVSLLPPYTPQVWLMLAVPKVLALAAGLSLWRMLKIGAYLFAIGIGAGWAMALALRTGFFPDLTVATIVSIIIVVASAWVLLKYWGDLQSLGNRETAEGMSDA